MTSVCVFRFVYTLPLRRNSEVKKMSIDSDGDIKEEDQGDVEESLTHKLASHFDVT